MRIARNSKLAGALALSIGLAAGGCAGMPTNASLYSTKQPVVERTNFTFDVNTNASGLAVSEQARLDGWFETMDLRYGDKVTVEDPTNSPAVSSTINELAGRYGIIIEQTAPTTAGYLQPGQARVVITRSSASVPGCPDWSNQSDANYNSGLSEGFGCGVNSNIAAMVANPQDLLEGQEGTGETVVATGTKAISTYRDAAPTGAGGLQQAQGGGE
ncbi:CpaD family pilus assembly protein [Erythrobacter sp. MTPC3]|uniref:CpaD family pilus assembly protein n=1 Tax=Erythrobacter sp. MTPC3 TaxID=3056564 RepID=UPI0036F1E4FD